MFFNHIVLIFRLARDVLRQCDIVLGASSIKSEITISHNIVLVGTKFWLVLLYIPHLRHMKGPVLQGTLITIRLFGSSFN